MAGTIFWDVDTQYDFMAPDGKLYVPDAETIRPKLRELTDFAHRHGIRVIASADDHVAGHRELSDTPDFRETFPPHCMRGTSGQKKISETRLLAPLVIEPNSVDPSALAARVRDRAGDILFHKHWFDVFTNPNVEPVVTQLGPERVVVYGVALDICNRYAIDGLRARYPDMALLAVTDAMKPIDPDRAGELLASWAESGVTLVDTAEAIDSARRGALRRELATE